MDNNTQNVTRDLARVILALTSLERRSVSVNSTCQYNYCTFFLNDHGEHNTTCRVSISDETKSEQLYFPIIARYIHLYIYPLFIVMGILGNSLSCFIMFLNVRRSGFPTSLYLTLLAFVDCLFILGSGLPDWLSQLDRKLDIKLLSDFSCRFVYWFGHFTTHLSAGLVVGVTVERFIAVQYPLIAHKVNTVKHTRIVLIILIIFFFLLDSPVFILVRKLDENVHIVQTCNNDSHATYERRVMVRCALANQQYKQAWVYVDFAVYMLIPFLIIGTLNSLIIHRLIDAQRFRERMLRIHNHMNRHDPQDVTHRQYSDSHEGIELMDNHQRHMKRCQQLVETQPLAIMLRPQISQTEERRIRFNTKLSSISTELSTLSFELKSRSNHRYEVSSIRHKIMHQTSSNNTRLTILLLFVSCSFLALTLPAVMLNLFMPTRFESSSSTLYNYQLKSITKGDNRSDTILYYTLARLLMIINHSINFILYFVLGKRFRRDLKKLFLGYWRKLHRQQHSSSK
ncbi:unnamed protein product [Adineta ricciae]|uniref:G-protein coupled receptors family 1 profile domain-containing protein n=1 Tax=Adineta ricciae TaxID=249248 RepID=A0A815E6C8_ADIRI|nr:unnamed protein product [Adineta ricciae]